MTVKEFKNTDIFKNAKEVRYFDGNDLDITDKPSIILDTMLVIGTSSFTNGSVFVDVIDNFY